jgi:hypothetical protein
VNVNNMEKRRPGTWRGPALLDGPNYFLAQTFGVGFHVPLIDHKPYSDQQF